MPGASSAVTKWNTNSHDTISACTWLVTRHSRHVPRGPRLSKINKLTSKMNSQRAVAINKHAAVQVD
jgi:hypothetical protein